MGDTYTLPNTLLFLALWFLGLTLFYFEIKVAVRNGVRQANVELIESMKALEKSVYEMEAAKVSRTSLNNTHPPARAKRPKKADPKLPKTTRLVKD
ncbi:MAG: hypothetical protein P4L59_21285 [Desulfosporosinus sp.]|nr:hypothetical protein [Desulfosporosinus sp.]